MTPLVYSRASIYRDYAGAIGGLALTIGPLLMIAMPTLPRLLCSVMVVVFAVYLWLTVKRHVVRFHVDEQSIRACAFRPSALSWSDIDDIRLRYFSTRRDGSRGWMTIRLSQGRHRIQIESTLDQFESILDRAARTVKENGLILDPASVQNFASSGYPIAGEEA